MKYSQIFILLCLLLLSACSGGTDAPSLPATDIVQTTPEVYASQTNIRANGVLLPIRQIELSFGTGGFIEAVEVSMGEAVRAGQPIVHLDTSEAAFALQLAEAELAAAQANYDSVAAGTPDEQRTAISAANLDLIVAQQALADIFVNAELKAAQALQTLVDAQKNLADAQRYLDSLTANANQASTDAAYANMILAKASLDKAGELTIPGGQAREQYYPCDDAFQTG